MKKTHFLTSFILFMIVCIGVGVIGSFWTKEAVSTWYPTLRKPAWTPPDWVFGPVWFTLYILIAISLWLIYTAKHSMKRSITLKLFTIQLALNFLWPFLFFFLRSPLLGLIDIILLCVFLLFTINKARSVRLLAAQLLIPYIIWVVYATSLNAGIWVLNSFL